MNLSIHLSTETRIGTFVKEKARLSTAVPGRALPLTL